VGDPYNKLVIIRGDGNDSYTKLINHR
jgi:hypothetical protein